MKKNFKTLIITLLSMTIAISMAIILAGCKKPVAETLELFDSPRAVYVQGQEIDLSQGSLMLKKGGSYKEIKLNESGVSVTGYNENVLGQQQVTITYNGKKVEYSVNVIPWLEMCEYQKIILLVTISTFR